MEYSVTCEETNEFFAANGSGCSNPSYKFTFSDGTILSYYDSSFSDKDTRYSIIIDYTDGTYDEADWGTVMEHKFSSISRENEYIREVIKQYVIYPFYKEDYEELEARGFKS